MIEPDPHEPFGDAFVAYPLPTGGRRLAQSAVLYIDVLGFASFSTTADAMFPAQVFRQPRPDS